METLGLIGRGIALVGLILCTIHLHKGRVDWANNALLIGIVVFLITNI